MKKSMSAGAAIVTLFFLLSHPTLAFQGASQGLLLWFHTVLPTLLPFMLCSNAIVMFQGVPLLTRPIYPFFHKLLKLSPNGCYVLIAGLLCGYPMGAKTCSEFLEDRRITLPEAKYLFAISNHPSPMFLLGFVGSSVNASVSMGKILLSLYLPILPIAWFAGWFYRIQKTAVVPNNWQQQEANDPSSSGLSFNDMMMASYAVMVRIGGYIMIFSILGESIRCLSAISPVAQSLLLGFVEITTGIQMITRTISGNLQGFLVLIVTAFGGLSGIFQTMAVKNAGLSIRHYTLWKGIHTLLSGALYLSLGQI